MTPTSEPPDRVLDAEHSRAFSAVLHATANRVREKHCSALPTGAHGFEQRILKLAPRFIDLDWADQMEVTKIRPRVTLRVDQLSEGAHITGSFIHIYGMVEVRSRSGSSVLPGFVMLRRDAYIANRFAAMPPSKYYKPTCYSSARTWSVFRKVSG